MIKTLVLTVVALGVCLAVYLYVYLGIYRAVSVTLETRGPYHLVFEPHLGPYHQILPKIKHVEAWAADHGLRCRVTFGEYLDDPHAVDEDRLRSRGGCVLAERPPTPPPAGIEYQMRAEKLYAVGHFEGSPAIGPYKVYPKVQKFLDERRLKSTAPVVELYTVDGDDVRTDYLFGVDNAP